METQQPIILRLGTRGSQLAHAQSQAVAVELMRLRPDVQVQLHIIKTTGDRIVDRPLHDVGGKGLFTKELELALLSGEIDFAVHSYKDVPVTMPLVDVSDLVIAAVPRREDVRDMLVGARSIADLPTGATVGTGSLRRRCQLLHHRPDLKIVSIRGNIDTRLKKQTSGELDAIVLAAAGLIRAGLFDEQIMQVISSDQMVPAACQGALALQCRADDESTRNILGLMNDPHSEQCTAIEREVIQFFNADCHSPIGVLAEFVDAKNMQLRAAIGTSEAVSFRSIVGSADSIREEIAIHFGNP